MSYFRLIYYYKLAFLKNIFGTTASSGIFNDAIASNFNRKTFRYPENATKDRLIFLKISRTILFAQFKKQKIELSNISSDVAIFDGDLINSEMRCNYVKQLSGEETKLVVGRTELINSVSFITSFLFVISVIIVTPFLGIISALQKNKLKYPLYVLNAFEALNLLYLLRKHKIKKLHFFCIYENDSNLMAYALIKNNIFINKITSESPLGVWNKCIVANETSFCFRYQEDEYKVFKETMHFDSFQHWIPERSFGLVPIYKNSNYAVKKGTIGFYSSAMWLRKKLGRIDLKDNAYLNEQDLFRFLLNFVKTDPKYKLVVFLHPLEKKDLEATKTYYNGLSDKIEFGDVNRSNTEQFFNAEVGVSLFSTLSWERLFWGFKTLIYPLGHDDFPIKNSNLNNVCAKSEIELKIKLNSALENNENDFFERNGLKNYRYFEYNVFKKIA